MKKINRPGQTKFRSLWIIAICIHILTFLLILDLYFTSPIKHGMTPQKSHGKPFSKRIVVFIADGLRAEAIYSEDNWSRVPFLSNLRLHTNCTWGVVHTGVPTESRPGHVAIFAGLYEDPSAILTGWKANIVEFDSVINQSNYVWSYGSPDIVKIFTKKDTSKLLVDYYDPNKEDFSGHSSTIQLDTWVFDKIQTLLKCDSNECKELFEDGNIFFLHLLGMDTAGHVHKPDSSQYIANLKALDTGIQHSVNLFNEYFNDNETTFLFTSDHGMTNWGSHGDGSKHETEVPYITWGKGIKANSVRMDLNQTDLAPLISSLIGIPIPINSVGITPHKILHGTFIQIAEALFANVLQHLEQYRLLVKEFKVDPFFKELPSFQLNDTENLIHDMRGTLNRGDTQVNFIEKCEDLMKDILGANKYMRNYYFKPKMAVVMLGFILWMVYLILSIYARENCVECIKFCSAKNLVQYFILVIIFVYLQYLKVKYLTYLYPILPLGIIWLFINNKQVMHQIGNVSKMNNKWKFFYTLIAYGVFVQLLVFGFFNRVFCAVTVIIMTAWLLLFKIPKAMKIRWLLVTGTLASLQVYKPSTQFSYYGLMIGFCLWICIYYVHILKEVNLYIKSFDAKYKLWTRNIVLCPLFVFIIAVLNTGYVAFAFERKSGLTDYNFIISWVITVVALVLIPVAPTGILIRFAQISASLIIPYTLMAVNMDLIFYCILVLTLNCWMEIETNMSNGNLSLRELHFSVFYSKDYNIKLSDQYRRTYFYLAFTVCYFFAIGNMASFNGFDPQWTRTYVATFNPFLMATLIIIKMIIPFFLINCAFYAIVLQTRSDDTTVFTMLLLFLEQMVLSFMLFVRNEGSWLDIGKSLSHFVVMEAMALVMLIFIGIAKYVCTYKLGKRFHPKEKRENRYQEDVEISFGDENYLGTNINNKVKKSWWSYLGCFICLSPKFKSFLSNSYPWNRNTIMHTTNNLPCKRGDEKGKHRRKGARCQYMKSSPTLIKINSNSTFITDAMGAETRINIESQKQMLENSFASEDCLSIETENEGDKNI